MPCGTEALMQIIWGRRRGLALDLPTKPSSASPSGPGSGRAGALPPRSGMGHDTQELGLAGAVRYAGSLELGLAGLGGVGVGQILRCTAQSGGWRGGPSRWWRSGAAAYAEEGGRRKMILGKSHKASRLQPLNRSTEGLILLVPTSSSK
ncbi:hypothetical protein TRIUR3_08649 [Triticum urartu]|uniref:Uncharacterized protein n=1 Tax=Triticum urartu TaxID=4572 RepID=M7YRH4_TRIUA|nr:hypothetical protein TRIUR3_08649 [Triticum urartu]